MMARPPRLAKLLDELVQRLIDEGYLNIEAPPQMPAGHQPVTGPGGLAQAAARDVQFNLTEKGIDFLGYQDAPQPARLARQVELRQPRHAVSRHGHRGRRVEQAVRVRRRAEHRRQRDAQERARAHRNDRVADRPRLLRPHGAAGRVPLVLRDGADARLLALDDPLRRGPLHAGEESRARAHASHPHAVPRRHAQGRALPRLGRGDPARDARARRRWARTTRTPPRV